MSAIDVRGVVKRFTYVALPKQTTLKETLVRRLLGRSMERRHIEAIGDVSFAVQSGEMLGIIGRNGSGKTTLMRLLAGIYAPDEGDIYINGKVAPLLAVGAGFHPDLTGRENARIELMILGFSPRQVDDRMQEIIDFAEIDEFIDSPVRTYSSGMMLRLAFSAAISVDPDVLLLDEVLSVGDQAFAEKCMARIDDFQRRNKTIVLVTHAIEVVRNQCDVAIWLDAGKMAAFGDPITVTDAYLRAAQELQPA